MALGLSKFNSIHCSMGYVIDSLFLDVANCGSLCSRRCGYSKAKQDPEEEKMHFHNGHSKQIVQNKNRRLYYYSDDCSNWLDNL